eukprot:8638373-Heterocapsa_arctica.AAC.1
MTGNALTHEKRLTLNQYPARRSCCTQSVRVFGKNLRQAMRNDMPSQAHSELLKTSHERSSIQRLSEYVTLVISALAVRNGAIKLWLSIYFAREVIFFHVWVEGLMKGTNASPLHSG